MRQLPGGEEVDVEADLLGSRLKKLNLSSKRDDQNEEDSDGLYSNTSGEGSNGSRSKAGLVQGSGVQAVGAVALDASSEAEWSVQDSADESPSLSKSIKSTVPSLIAAILLVVFSSL